MVYDLYGVFGRRIKLYIHSWPDCLHNHEKLLSGRHPAHIAVLDRHKNWMTE